MIEKNKRVRSKFIKLVAISILISLPTFGAIALWRGNGVWIPLAIVFPISMALGVLIAKRFYRDTAFICAKCNGIFKPPFKKVMFTSGTIKARWLTCTKCGHAGYCAETIADNK